MALRVKVQRCDVKQRHFPGQVSRGLVNASSRALLSAELTSLVNPVRTMKAFIYECQKALNPWLRHSAPARYTPLMAPAVAVACTPRRALKVHPPLGCRYGVVVPLKGSFKGSLKGSIRVL